MLLKGLPPHWWWCASYLWDIYPRLPVSHTNFLMVWNDACLAPQSLPYWLNAAVWQPEAWLNGWLGMCLHQPAASFWPNTRREFFNGNPDTPVFAFLPGATSPRHNSLLPSLGHPSSSWHATVRPTALYEQTSAIVQGIREKCCCQPPFIFAAEVREGGNRPFFFFFFFEEHA